MPIASFTRHFPPQILSRLPHTQTQINRFFFGVLIYLHKLNADKWTILDMDLHFNAIEFTVFIDKRRNCREILFDFIFLRSETWSDQFVCLIRWSSSENKSRRYQFIFLLLSFLLSLLTCTPKKCDELFPKWIYCNVVHLSGLSECCMATIIMQIITSIREKIS